MFMALFGVKHEILINTILSTTKSTLKGHLYLEEAAGSVTVR
ncbi:hypothetical protein ACUL41_14450 [Virgibacillus natechei]